VLSATRRRYIGVMPRRHAIVIAVDGLRASALGAYGNTIYATPALDALAARSTLVEWMLCTGPRVEDFYRAAWHDGQAPPLLELLEQAEVDCLLTTDAAEIAASVEQLPSGEVRQLEIIGDRSADSIADTGLAQLFTIAIDQVAAWADGAAAKSGERSQLLWLHARGFHGPWDAPRELREELLAEDDLAPPEFVTPPQEATVDEPDELLRYRAAYAAQALVLDACVEALLTALADSGLDEETLVVLVGCRGFALGEHGMVGGGVQSLYSEMLHVPCLVRPPGTESPPPRIDRLAQPGELYSLIRNWFGPDGGTAADERSGKLAPVWATSPPLPYVMVAGAEGEHVLRTPAWMLRRRPGTDPMDDGVELYAKPFDRWEANEVSARRPDIVERMLAILDAATSGQPIGVLDAELLEPAG
jgi:hypothetical protein